MAAPSSPPGEPARSANRAFALLLLGAVVAFYAAGLLPGRILLPVDILCGSLPWGAQEKPAAAGCAGRQNANPVLSDQVFQFYPWRALVRREGWGGALWNPYSFAGSPLLANGQSAFLAPLNWLHLLLPATWSYVLLAMLRTGLAAGFTWAFARRHVSPPAAAVAAAAYSFSYAFVFSLGYPIGDALAWMPALFWAADARRWVVLAAVTALELLAGQPETALVAFLALTGYFVAGRPSGREALWAGLAVVAGALCAAPQWLPLLQYLNHSAASRLRAEYNPLFYSPHTLLELLTPDFFGTASATQRWGSNEGGYFGLLPVLLIAAWLFSRPRAAIRNPFLWIFLASLGFIYRVPPLAWLLELPHLRTIYVSKFWATATFAGAMLAAYAWEEFAQRRIRPVVVFCLLPSAFCLLLLGARWHFREFISALNLSSFENWVLARFVFFLALALLTLRFRPSLAVLLVVVESYAYLGRYNTAAPAALLYPATPVVDFLRRSPERMRIMGDGVLPPNTAAVYGLEDVRGYDAITPWSYFRYMTAIDSSFPDLSAHMNLGPQPLSRETLFLRDRFERSLHKWGQGFREFLHRVYYWNDRLTRVERPALLDLLNVKYYLVPRGARPPPGADDYRLVFSAEVDVYENPHPMPRAFVVGAWEFAGNEEAALEAIRRSGFDPHRKVILCCAVSGPRPPTPVPDFRAAEVLSYRPTEVVVRATGPGALVLADSFYPGWRAEGFTLYRADYLFRGVLLPPGTHRVRFFYWPSP